MLCAGFDKLSLSGSGCLFERSDIAQVPFILSLSKDAEVTSPHHPNFLKNSAAASFSAVCLLLAVACVEPTLWTLTSTVKRAA